MQDIEIPWANQRGKVYRLFEMVPGLLSYSLLLAPIVLSIFNPTWVAYFLLTYVLIWVFKAIALSSRLFQGYHKMRQATRLDWWRMVQDLATPAKALKHPQKPVNALHAYHYQTLAAVKARGGLDIKPDQVIHAVVIATYNEPPDIINPTIEYVANNSGVNRNNTALFIAYEQRGGPKKAKQTQASLERYRHHFMHAEAIEHVLDTSDEIPGKGSNATYTGLRIKAWAEEQGLDPSHVLVTVLDADNRADINYFACLTYTYLLATERKYKSYQPISLYINNIWDVPAIMRLSATANTYFHTANSMRLHALRNFSAHSQSLDALLETDFWSMRTIVEDGHQFWRSYFAFDGHYEVLPLYTPIYQDAVYAGGYKKTLISQFKQIRRWTYGASDIAYVATQALKRRKQLKSRLDIFFKLNRLIEAHVGWATSTPIILLYGWLPLILYPDSGSSVVAQQLPQVIGRINTLAVVLVLVILFISFATLPPRPKYHRKIKYLNFIWQLPLIPVTGLVFNSLASLSSQTRLLFGRYLETFDLTEKVTKSGDSSNRAKPKA